MSHGIIMTKTSDNFVSPMPSHGRYQSQSLWSKPALSISPFVPPLSPARQDSVSTSTMGLNVELPPVSTDIPAKYAKNPTPKFHAQEKTSQSLIKNHPITKLPTPIKSNILCNELSGYDTSLRHSIVDGFKSGFRLGCTEFQSESTCRNHSSIYQNQDHVQLKLSKEMNLGRIAGPFHSKPFDNFHCSPLGLIPKKSMGEFRIIHDLSFPKGNSVNDHIGQEFVNVQYDSIETIIDLVQNCGPNSLMAKLDIEDGYRNVPIHPADYHFLGFVWEGQFYYDKCLPMGASSSCQIFEKLSTALQWIMMTKYKAHDMSHLLDDFFFIGPSKSNKCLQDVICFERLCKRLGIPLKQSKTVYPTTKLTIYGIEIDSINMECRLPNDKLFKIRQLLVTTINRKRITLHDLQSIIGLLNFACLVVTPGRAFLRRLIDLTCNVSKPHHFIRLNNEARADLKAWQLFISHFNGKSVFLQRDWHSSEKLRLYTDASGSLGYAAVFGSKWFAKPWKDIHAHYNITIKELFPIVLILELWGATLSNCKVIFFSDNQAVVEVINKQSSREKTIMRLLRRLVIAAMSNNIMFKAKHIIGKTNVIPDKLSRLKFQEARTLAPWLDVNPTELSDHMVFI